MKNNVKTTQRFTWIDADTKENKHYLLMPNEVKEIEQYLENFPERNLLNAFAHFTGKNYMQVTNLKLEVIYY
jgi:hypothetical protein